MNVYRQTQLGIRVPACMTAGVMRVHLCRVAGNTVWSHMASDVPHLYEVGFNPGRAISAFTFLPLALNL